MSEKHINIIAWLLLAAALTACASRKPPEVLYASDALYRKNPIRNVAVWVETEVRFPRWENKGAIGYRASRGAAEKAAPTVSAVLMGKGYAVVAAKAAAVSYPAPVAFRNEAGERWVIDSKVEGKSWTVPLNEPVYVFDESFGTPETARCVQLLSESESLAHFRQDYRERGLDRSVAARLARETGADTLCRVFVFGNTTTGGRKTANAFMNAIPYVSARDDDLTTARVSCYGASDGGLVFSNEVMLASNPTLPLPMLFETLLEHLPDANEPMDPTVVLARLQPPGTTILVDPYPTVSAPPAPAETAAAEAPDDGE